MTETDDNEDTTASDRVPSPGSLWSGTPQAPIQCHTGRCDHFKKSIKRKTHQTVKSTLAPSNSRNVGHELTFLCLTSPSPHVSCAALRQRPTRPLLEAEEPYGGSSGLTLGIFATPDLELIRDTPVGEHS